MSHGVSSSPQPLQCRIPLTMILGRLDSSGHVRLGESTSDSSLLNTRPHSYGASLIFQLWSHAHLYADKGEYAPMKSTKYPKRAPRHPGEPGRIARTRQKLHLGGGASKKEEEAVASTTAINGENGTIARSTTGMSNVSGTIENGALSPLEEGSHEGSHTVTTSEGDIEAQDEEEDEEEVPKLTMWTALGLLTVVTVLVAVTAEFLVSSIDGLTSSGTISEEWVGLILLPIVGNAAEHVTAVTVSVKDKLDLSIGVAVGSSIQIALFVIPMLVILGWILGKPLTLLFDPFESIVLFLAGTCFASRRTLHWSNMHIYLQSSPSRSA